MADTLVTLFEEDRPNFYQLSDIYDPSVVYVPGETRVIPKVRSLVMDASGRLYWVTAVDPVTYASTLKPASIVVTDETEGDQVSIVSYGNDVFYVYTDARNAPTRLQPDSRLVLYGNVATYRLVKDKGLPTEAVVSRYYDTDGNYVGSMIPMNPVQTDTGVNTGMSYGSTCHTLETLADGTRLTMEVYNSHGALAATMTCFTQASAIANEALGYRPTIVDLKITATQTRDNGELFLYEKQDPDSLNVQVSLVYDDGNEVPVTIDSQKCFLYGLEDFVAAWQGLRQTLLVKYYLNYDEVVDAGLAATNFITKEIDLVVIPNEAGAGLKVSVLPQWSVALSAYHLRYFLYSTDRDAMMDVTTHVTITDGAFVGTLYGAYQTFILEIDLSQINPTVYTEPVYHRQSVSIRLQPIAALERYLIRDTMLSPTIYGVDAPSSRRPVLHYDATLEQYFVPSTVFATPEAFLQSFYDKATPPYAADAEEAPPVPTHFVLRDLNSGAMVVADRIALADYAAAFSVTGVPKNRYVDTTVVVEFLHEVDESTVLICYGVPVDCSLSATGYVP
jgi:hypothetical protein